LRHWIDVADSISAARVRSEEFGLAPYFSGWPIKSSQTFQQGTASPQQTKYCKENITGALVEWRQLCVN